MQGHYVQLDPSFSCKPERGHCGMYESSVGGVGFLWIFCFRKLVAWLFKMVKLAVAE